MMLKKYGRETVLNSHIVHCDPNWEMWRQHPWMKGRVIQDDFWGQGNPTWLTQDGLVNLEVQG